jgi:pimeloyl-ACP methyl ester carboxylesterase
VKITLDNGVTLGYDDVGQGSGVVVLTHGLGGNRTHVTPQMEHYSQTYRVVNVDLRGHGQSDAPLGSYNPDVLADDLALLCRKLELDRPIYIGHSVGGAVGLRLAHLHPGLLRALVALDSSIAVPQAVVEITAGLVAELEQLEGEDYRSRLAEILEGFFLPTDDPFYKLDIITSMTRSPKHVFLSGWVETVMRCDTVSVFDTLKTPMLFVASQSAGGGLDVIRGGKGVTVGQTVGTGHFIQVDCPDQVHPMVDRWLAVNGLA